MNETTHDEENPSEAEEDTSEDVTEVDNLQGVPPTEVRVRRW